MGPHIFSEGFGILHLLAIVAPLFWVVLFYYWIQMIRRKFFSSLAFLGATCIIIWDLFMFGNMLGNFEAAQHSRRNERIREIREFVESSQDIDRFPLPLSVDASTTWTAQLKQQFYALYPDSNSGSSVYYVKPEKRELRYIREYEGHWIGLIYDPTNGTFSRGVLSYTPDEDGD